MLRLLKVRPQRLLIAAAHKRQAQLCQRIEFLLFAPNPPHTLNFALAQGKHNGGFVGVFNVFLRYTAPALTALTRRGLMLDGNEIAVPHQIAGYTRPAVDDGQGQPL